MQNLLKSFLKKIKLNEPVLSTILGGFVLLFVGILIFNYFKKENNTKNEKGETTPILSEDMKKAGVELKEITLDSGEKQYQQIYKVKTGDSLWQISQNVYANPWLWPTIAQENKISNPDLLLVEQELVLPKIETDTQKEEMETIDKDEYQVVEGDNLWNICIRAYADGYKWVEVAQFNQLKNPDLLEIGQKLKLPR